MNQLEALKLTVTGGGILSSALLVFWKTAEAHLLGVGLTPDWYGLVEDFLLTVVAAATTIGGVLHITIPSVRLPKEE